jgi:hypothetical protein
MKSTSFLILFLYLLSSCQTPEWKKRGFESEYIYNEYINDSVVKVRDAWKTTIPDRWINKKLYYFSYLTNDYDRQDWIIFYKDNYFLLHETNFFTGEVFEWTGKVEDMTLISSQKLVYQGSNQYKPSEIDPKIIRIGNGLDGSKMYLRIKHIYWNTLKGSYAIDERDYKEDESNLTNSEDRRDEKNQTIDSTTTSTFNNKKDIVYNFKGATININEATKIYKKFSSAIRKEDVDLLKTFLAPTLDVWHDKSNIDRESLISNWEVNYVSKWSVSKDVLIDITKGSRINEFKYKKSYTVISKKNINDVREFEISGYFLLNQNRQIIEMKDQVTKRRN